MLVLAACASDDDGSTGHPILLSVGQAVTAEATRAAVVGTKMPEGSEVGLFAYAYHAGDDSWPAEPDVWNNERAMVQAQTIGGSGSLLKPDVAGFYDEADVTLNYAIYAYHPYVEALTATDPVIAGDLFEAMDNAGNGQHDWMWSTPLKGVTAEGYAGKYVPLRFAHLTTMLCLKVGVRGETTAGPELRRIGVKTGGSQAFFFDVSAGTLLPAEGGKSEYNCKPTPNTGDDTYIIPWLAMDDTAYYAKPVPTEVAENILVMPATQITGLSFVVDNRVYTTVDIEGGWPGFAVGQAGTFHTISLVLTDTDLCVEIGAPEWIDENTRIAMEEAGVELGADDWNAGQDQILMLQGTVMEIGADDWQDADNNHAGQDEMELEVGAGDWQNGNDNTLGFDQMEMEVGTGDWQDADDNRTGQEKMKLEMGVDDWQNGNDNTLGIDQTEMEMGVDDWKDSDDDNRTGQEQTEMEMGTEDWGKGEDTIATYTNVEPETME